jgi:asparaginyl-tRNA synthetase
MGGISMREQSITSEETAAVASIESELLKSARTYFEKNNFTEVVVPHITRITGACENIDTLFGLNYFGEDAFLVQTGQLYLEALIPRLGNVFCIGPSFRAEPGVDERHLTEFTLVEIEFPGDFNALLTHVENTIYEMLHGVLKNKRHDLELLGVDITRLEKIKLPFRRMTYTEAIEKLLKYGIEIKWGDDLKSLHEKMLVADGTPTFITHYPEAIKFFNMRRNDDNNKVVNSSDLILPFGGEAVGSAEREHDYDVLKEKLLKSTMYKQLQEKGKNIDDFGWYLDVVKKHKIQHAGCGIGLNRVTQFILGSNDIRHSTAYPMNAETLM